MVRVKHPEVSAGMVLWHSVSGSFTALQLDGTHGICSRPLWSFVHHLPDARAIDRRQECDQVLILLKEGTALRQTLFSSWLSSVHTKLHKASNTARYIA